MTDELYIIAYIRSRRTPPIPPEVYNITYESPSGTVIEGPSSALQGRAISCRMLFDDESLMPAEEEFETHIHISGDFDSLGMDYFDREGCEVIFSVYDIQSDIHVKYED